MTPDEDDIYDFCVLSHALSHIQPGAAGSIREVNLQMKHGVEAKNYEQLAAVSQLKPLELELTKLEDLSSSIVQDFEYMKQREQEMRDTNESTNNRVFYLSIFSMLCLASLALWQILYLKKFFKSKKLIDWVSGLEGNVIEWNVWRITSTFTTHFKSVFCAQRKSCVN